VEGFELSRDERVALTHLNVPPDVQETDPRLAIRMGIAETVRRREENTWDGGMTFAAAWRLLGSLDRVVEEANDVVAGGGVSRSMVDRWSKAFRRPKRSRRPRRR
jgi:hypothetical protein